MKRDNRFVYCDWWKCPHTECLRHKVNTPMNVLIRIKKFKPDKSWNCKDILYNLDGIDIPKDDDDDELYDLGDEDD